MTRSGILGLISLCVLCVSVVNSLANPPVASYIFPAGGQRGTTVPVRVGGLFLHERCGFDLHAKGVAASRELTRTDRVWFEGPLLPLPESQQAEDYPADMLGRVTISQRAALGPVRGRLVTSQGAAGGLVFVVGELPEVVERERDGRPIPERVALPVTANGRVFPREDVDLWEFRAAAGQSVAALAVGPSIRSPLRPRLEILDATGRVLAESGPHPAAGSDASVRFVAPAAGVYRVRVSDVRSLGGPAFVYRLTITAGPAVEAVFPLGGRRGTKTLFRLAGQAVPDQPVAVELPADAPDLFRHAFAVGGVATFPVPLDLDDYPEFIAPAGEQPIAAPAVMNGRVASSGAADVWRLRLKKGQSYKLDLLARRLGSPLCGVLTVADAAGKELAHSDGVDGDPALAFQPPADGTYRVRVGERFRGRGGPAFAYRLKVVSAADIAPDFRLTLPGDALTLLRKGTAKLQVTAERFGGFNGPIELTVAGLPAGVTVKPATIRAGSAALLLQAGEAAPIRDARLVVTGTATVAGRSVTRRAVVRATRALPGADAVLLAVELPTPFKIASEYVMTTAPCGGVYRRRYRIERNGFAGPITVQLADRQARHLQGVTGPVVTVAPGHDTLDYPALLPPWMELGRTCRVCVMAVGTIRDADGREHAVSFSSTEPNQQMIVVVGPGRLGVEPAAASVRAEPNRVARIPVRLSRGKGVDGPITVKLVVPAHWEGVTAAPVAVPAGARDAVLEVRFGRAPLGPFNRAAVIRAVAGTPADPIVAEVNVEFVPDRDSH
jgi:hypothetical protein